jgi:hypothetical protein
VRSFQQKKIHLKIQMASTRPLIPTPQKPAGQAIFVPGGDYEKRLPISTFALFIITILVVLIIIFITWYYVRKIKNQIIEFPVDTDVLDLNALIDLEIDGQCCMPPSALISSKRWIYSPSNNFTFSSDKLQPAIICQGLTSTNLTNCLNFVTGTDGGPKILAHKGTEIYYGFAPGPAGPSICTSYTSAGTC